jgi:protoporphyrinogen/coproporphyrinogen III oxidase
MNRETKDVVVLGGGISGLTVAWELKKAGVDVCLLEKSGTVGGCTRSEKRDGFLLEKGPFNVIVRDPNFETLLSDVANNTNVVSANKDAKLRYIYRNNRLHTVPTNPVAMLTTKMLSPSARLRMLRGLFLSKRSGASEDTIEQVASRRIGPEATDTIVSAAISGIFSGDIAKLSLPACFPSVAAIDADARSLIGYGLKRAFAKKNKKHTPRWRGMVSLNAGLGALTHQLGEKLGGDCIRNATVQSLRQNDTSFAIVYNSCGEEHTLRARRVVLAVPVQEATRLLEPLLPRAAQQLSPIKSASLAVLNLAYNRSDVGHELRGFGFLVPRNEPTFPLMGVLFSNSIFPHYAPPDQHLLRVFIGGARDPDATKLSDGQLIDRAQEGLRNTLSISGQPTLTDIVRHAPAIPQYHLGHRERIAEFRKELSKLPGLFAAGNYLDGVSLNDCVRVGTRCADDVKRNLQDDIAIPNRATNLPCAVG